MESENMAAFYKATLLPRLLVLAGALSIALTVFGPVQGEAGAMMQVAGGFVSLAGLVWYILAFRTAKRR
jgi:hypothetical protein